MSKHFNPNHGHDGGWYHDSNNDWSNAPIECNANPCPSYATPYSFVPVAETSIYATLLEDWGFANNVLQANEGPSFVAHQYFIAGQSGGAPEASSSPDGESENPGDPPAPPPTGNYIGADNEDMATSGCNPSGYTVGSVNMSLPVASSPPLDNGGAISPCEEYAANILDEVSGNEGTPTIADWQYIAHADSSIWAAPLGIQHLWNAYHGAPDQGLESFAVDPDAENFVLNITSSSNPTPNPSRPIASLTYITPCIHESDHAQLSGSDDGPQWLAWVLNAIGESSFWNSSVIFVTWDDWGGWYDNVPATPFRPLNNDYGNSDDPNEWGFRVPLIVISPYLKERGYISSVGNSGFTHRSQSVILQYIEATFDVPSLGTDDKQDNQSDGLADMFNYSRSPILNWEPLSTSFSPQNNGNCPGGGDAVRIGHHGVRKVKGS